MSSQSEVIQRVSDKVEHFSDATGLMVDVADLQVLLAEIADLEKTVAAIDPEKLREIAKWFDTVDDLLDIISTTDATSGKLQSFRDKLARSDEIQQDLRNWADALDTVEHNRTGLGIEVA
jgi:hypothetical protein